MPPIRAIFFDIGDTLVFDDPPLRERFACAARLTVSERLALPAAFRAGEEDALRRYLQGVLWDAPDSLRASVACTWDALGKPPLSGSGWQEFSGALAAAPFTRRVHPDAFALLGDLKERGFVLGAVSDWEDTLPGLLADLGLAPYFTALAVSAVVGVTKPDPRLFGEALRHADVPPAQSLHVGDWYELDVAGARAAGMPALLLDQQGRRPEADCPRVTTFAELADYLRTLPAPRLEDV